MSVTPNDPAAPLDCASAQGLIDAFLLDELDAPASSALRLHLSGCAACSADLRGITRLMGALAVLPAPPASSDLDARIVLAAIADRQQRHERRSWLQDMRTLVFRGAVRTTTTLAVTVVTVALIGATLVFAASNFLAGTAFNPTRSDTVVPVVTPPDTAAPTTAPTGTKPPVVISVTPGPTPAPTPEPTLAPEPTATAEPAPTEPPVAAPTAAPTPTAVPTPTPTEKPRRTPPPTESPAPSADVTQSP